MEHLYLNLPLVMDVQPHSRNVGRGTQVWEYSEPPGVYKAVCVHVNADLVCSSAELLDLSNTDHNSKYLLYTRI